ncbi:MAG: hypothetical protein AAFQ42_06610 [Pseudomonadota bacterium]
MAKSRKNDDYEEDTTYAPEDNPRRNARGHRQEYDEFEVALWVTNLNPTEIGIYQHARNRAKSRQFTKDMDIFSEVKENGERTCLMAYRKELWEENDGMDRRLVIKHFTAELNWRGTLDLLLGRSVQLTHGAGGFPVPAYSINVTGHDQLVQVERSAYKWPGQPESFSFFVLRDKKPCFYRLRRNWISIGDDYSLYDEHDRRVGKLNGRVINIGGKWKCWVEKEHSCKVLLTVLQLFCAMLRFNDDCRHHIQDLVSEMHGGDVVPKLGHHEADLYMNPRRVR